MSKRFNLDIPLNFNPGPGSYKNFRYSDCHI